MLQYLVYSSDKRTQKSKIDSNRTELELKQLEEVAKALVTTRHSNIEDQR